ncbi:MAG TPA: IPT/TIG domain-containing protein, partial [Pyrinomonadaceae bacterium]|nr:IPT/TIG domain-containing protein [Pyrinomonadaceae bacterium]
MDQIGKITRVNPPFAIPGGEIVIECEGFRAGHRAGTQVFIGEESCRIVAASSNRVLAIVPEGDGEGHTQIHLESGGARSVMFPIVVGKLLVGGMHIVANPAVDPSDDALILTRSGSRGQHLPATLFRLEPDGYLDELPEAILNPTGIAYDRNGQMFVTNRAQGEVYSVGREGTTS